MSSEGIEDVYDLGPLQEGILVHSLCYPNQGLFVRQITLPLSAATEPAWLCRAWEHLAAEASILRTAFVWEGVEFPVQVVRTKVSLRFREVDLTGYSKQAAAAEHERLAEQERREGFDLRSAPLFRLLAVRTLERVYLVWTYHHILIDAWSAGLLLEALERSYDAVQTGRPLPRGHLRPYREFIARIKREPLDAAEAYWRSELKGFVTATPLSRRTGTQAAARMPGAANAELVLELPETVQQGVERVARSFGVTPYTVFEGAWALILSARAGSLDVVFGTAVSGRMTERPGLESVVGLLSNVLPHRVRVERAARLSEWLRRLQSASADRFRYQHVPQKKVRAWSDIPGGAPLFLSTLVYEPAKPHLPDFIKPEAHVRARDHEWSGHPVTVFFAPSQQFIWFVYDSIVLEDDELRTIARSYQMLLRELVRGRDDTLAELLRLLEQGEPSPLEEEAASRVRPRPGWASSSQLDEGRGLRPAFVSQAGTRGSTALEERLEALWCDALKKERIGWADNVFDLGADSFLLVRVHARMERELGVQIPLTELFNSPTVNLLARSLRGAPSAAGESDIAPRTTGPRELEPMKAYDDIAVIGMHVNAPGAPNLDAFWRVVREGREVISFFSDDELDAAGVPRSVRADPNYVPAGAPLPGIELFDAAFFGVNPGDAEVMDPQLRRFLEASWSVIESAGYDPQRLDVPVGVYAGSAISTYLLSNLLSSATHREMLARTGLLMHLNERDALSTYVSYKLDLKGPSVAVQTMCSTALVAVHLACQGLRTGECDMALAGGVSINVHQAQGYVHQEGLYFSPDGHTRPFEARASGTIFSSGVGVVMLKRLDEAVRDGDEIHAVIIGSALNNDGSAKAGFTAPSVAGQAKAISEAHAVAGAEAESIGYVEAHGTGTPLGDLIEVEALTRAFRRKSQKRGYCCLGSAKANFGHLDKAAGIVGLIKACLVVKHAELPPTVNFHAPNPRLNLASSPFYVRTHAGEWHTDGQPRRAGVSSFGIGGTNAHVVLQEAPRRDPSRPARDAQLLIWSARTPSALEALTDSLAAALEEEPSRSLPDFAYVGHVGRSAFACRRALVSGSSVDAAQAMRARDPERIRGSVAGATNPPDVLFMFPGGGARYQAMARGVFDCEPVFREHIERAHALLHESAGVDLIDLLVSPGAGHDRSGVGIDDVLTLQVALFSVEYATARLLMHWGIRPSALIGHSVGEYVAACLAGVFTFEEALQLLVIRGRLMREMPPSGMLVVFRSEADVRGLLSADIHLTAVNGPAQCVVSGSVAAIDKLHAELLASEVDCQPLSVGIASHSPMMQPMAGRLIEAVARLDLRPPSIPFVSCVTGTWMTPEDAVAPAYWGEHLTRTVRFADGLATAVAGRSDVLLEVGPGHGLANLARERMPASEHGRVISCNPRSSVEDGDRTALLDSLGQLWLCGVRVDWRTFHEHETLHRVSLPTYPFEGRRYWVDEQRSPEPSPAQVDALARRSDIADWFYLPSWRRTLLPSVPQSARVAPEAADRCILVLAGNDDVIGLRLARNLADAGHRVIVVSPDDRFSRTQDGGYGVRSANDDDYGDLFADLTERRLVPDRIVHGFSLQMRRAADADAFERGHTAGLYSLLALLRAVTARAELVRAEISVVLSKVNAIEARDEVWPERSVLQALCRVVPQEYPTLRCRCIEIDDARRTNNDGPVEDEFIEDELIKDELIKDELIKDEFQKAEPDSPAIARLAAHLSREILSGASDSVVAYRGAHRWVRAFEPARLDPLPRDSSPWRDTGVYLITGGLGKIGLTVAEHILARVDATVVLVGRSAPDDDIFPARDDARNGDVIPEALERVRALRSRGARIHVRQGDVSDRARMLAIVGEVRERFGGLHGVVHAAGVTDPVWFCSLREPGTVPFEGHFRSKVHGLYALEQALGDVEELEFCLLLSSLSAHLGGLGHAAYAAANAFMDAFARARADVSQPRWISVNSELWRFGGQPASGDAWSSGLGASLEGLKISTADAGDAFDRILMAGRASEIAVSTCDLGARYRQWAIGETAETEATPDLPGSPQVHERSASLPAYVPPRDAIERHVAHTWAEVLSFEQVGVEDDFFRLGGHSISAIRIVARLRNTLGVEISVADLLTHPTVARLSAVIGSQTGGEAAAQARRIDEILRLVESSVPSQVASQDPPDKQEGASRSFR